MQAYARVCEEKYKLEEKDDCPFKFFEVKGSTFKGCKPKMGEPMVLKCTIMTLHSIKVLSHNTCISGTLTVVMETSAKNLGLAGS